MIKTTAIDEFKIGQKVYGFYQSIFKEKKISKHGDYYIDILLRDKTGQINGKIWNFIDFYDSVFNEGDLVSVKGEIKRYRKKLFIEIDNISFLDFERYKKYGFEDKNIYPSIDVSPDIIFNRIIKLIKKLDNPYKNLLLNIYNHYKDKIKLYPDDISLFEYNKKGSLILKIYNTLKIAASIHKNKSQNDKNMIMAGILLKYIGRVKQYDYDVIFSFSKIGRNEDCFMLSRDIVRKFSKKIKKIPENFINDLVDIILFKSSSSNEDFQNYIG